ncbi:MAG TPA: hypothetical protein VF719_12320, partial [Abditibacteriaceae bacterium]
TGLEIKRDPETGVVIPPFKTGIDRMLFAGKDATFGEFSRADLTHFIEVQNSLRAAIARIAGLPLHFFMLGDASPPSGESLRVAAERLTSKVRDRQIAFGNTDEDVMRFCLQIRGLRDVEVQAIWNDPAPQPTETEKWQSAQAQVQFTGKAQVLRERNYSEEQITQFQAESFNDEFGDGAAPTTHVWEDAPGEDTKAPAPGSPADAGISAEKTLNGAQISAALEVMDKVKAGLLSSFSAVELLVSIGVDRVKAEEMVSQIV